MKFLCIIGYQTSISDFSQTKFETFAFLVTLICIISVFWCRRRNLLPLLCLVRISSEKRLNKGSWYFFLSKVVDLLDTIFFVLRKKQSQVTFLHVYHHSNMAVTCWAYLRFIKGEQATLPGVINSFIHTVMYFYYFLAALGPHMQPYLWWKKYLTRMQIIQFVIIMIWYVGLLTFSCEFPKVYMCYMAANVGLFLYLFSLFYSKTYAEKPKTVKTN